MIFANASRGCALSSSRLMSVNCSLDHHVAPTSRYTVQDVLCRRSNPPSTTLYRSNNKKSQSNLGEATSPPFMVENNYTTKSPLVTMGCPTLFHQNFSFDDLRSHLIHPSLDRPHSPTQTASRSNEPFCHSTSSRQTD